VVRPGVKPSRKLVIIESPAKAKSLRVYLGPEYEVVASMGHVRDLPQRRLGVAVDDGFKPLYTVLPEKRKTLADLRRVSAGYDTILLAADPDREGEAICWHLSELLARGGVTFRRLRFNAVTREAVLAAVARPSQIDMNLVDAQQARRVMDRLVGYRISPYLWRVISSGLSAGRVQTVALRLVQEREDEVLRFIPAEYWSFSGSFEAGGIRLGAALSRLNGLRIDGAKNAPGSEVETGRLLPEMKGASWAIRDVKRSDFVRRPGPPFMTSSLQQAASSQLGFSPSRTMSLAQELYEGVDLEGEGHSGLITYMRTDSVRIEPEAISSCREFIEQKLGPDHLSPSPRRYRSAGGSQDAHEAIRPTVVSRTPESLAGMLSEACLKLYRLIWRRTVASQCSDAISEKTEVAISGGRFEFSCSGEVLTFPGFLSVDASQASISSALPAGICPGPAALLEVSAEQHFTKPPARFSEAGLVSEMKKNGLGRPSTYVSILETLKKRGYVKIAEKKLLPTELGTSTVRLLLNLFPHIFDTGFTAGMEKLLDSVADGSICYEDAVRQLETPLDASLKQAVANLDTVRESLAEETTEICPECGSPLRLRLGRYGRFLSCSGYPGCRYTRQEGETRYEGDRKCPLCSSALVRRTGRFGQYLACEKAPACRHTEPIPMGVPCPADGCGGEMIQKMTRKGRLFYSCSRYPKCDFAMWNRPVPGICPKCGFPVLEEGKKGLQCPRCRKKIEESSTSS
jgi:DNA topoisomerase-1